jgi:hypothetical protein
MRIRLGFVLRNDPRSLLQSHPVPSNSFLLPSGRHGQRLGLYVELHSLHLSLDSNVINPQGDQTIQQKHILMGYVLFDYFCVYFDVRNVFQVRSIFPNRTAQY